MFAEAEKAEWKRIKRLKRGNEGENVRQNELLKQKRENEAQETGLFEKVKRKSYLRKRRW